MKINYAIYDNKEDLNDEDVGIIKKFLKDYFFINKELLNEVSTDIKLYNHYSYVYSPRTFTFRYVDAVSPYIKTNQKILDMFSGCGIVGLSFAKDNQVTCSDISKESIEEIIANKNINDLEVEVIQSDCFKNIKDKYDIVLGVPPMMSTIQYNEKLKKFPGLGLPREAFDAGNDELKYFKEIFKNCHKYLLDGGMVFLPVKTNEQQKLIEECLQNYPRWKFEFIKYDEEDFPASILKLYLGDNDG